MDTKSSGASNRAKHELAQAARQSESSNEPLRLSVLPPERAARAREAMDLILTGAVRDPDAVPDYDLDGIEEDD